MARVDLDWWLHIYSKGTLTHLVDPVDGALPQLLAQLRLERPVLPLEERVRAVDGWWKCKGGWFGGISDLASATVRVRRLRTT